MTASEAKELREFIQAYLEVGNFEVMYMPKGGEVLQTVEDGVLYIKGDKGRFRVILEVKIPE